MAWGGLLPSAPPSQHPHFPGLPPLTPLQHRVAFAFPISFSLLCMVLCSMPRIGDSVLGFWPSFHVGHIRPGSEPTRCLAAALTLFYSPPSFRSFRIIHPEVYLWDPPVLSRPLSSQTPGSTGGLLSGMNCLKPTSHRPGQPSEGGQHSLPAVMCWEMFNSWLSERAGGLICQFPWDKYSHHGLFRATNVMLTDLQSSRNFNDELSRARLSWLQHTMVPWSPSLLVIGKE